MSQGSPSKQYRIERHLSRQRGAGVRSLTAQFGFSFTVPDAPIFPVQDAPEPPRKRVKTSNPGSSKRCTSPQQHAPRTQAHSADLLKSAVPARGKDDYGRIQEEAAMPLKVAIPVRRQQQEKLSLGQEQILVSTKAAKALEWQILEASGRDEEKAVVRAKTSKSVKRQAKQNLSSDQENALDSAKPVKRQRKKKGTPVVDDMAAACDNSLGREVPRPRRRAAVAAAVKVVEAYVEEEADVDKKRRVEEPVIKKRRGRSPKVHKDDKASKEHVADVEVPMARCGPIDTNQVQLQEVAHGHETICDTKAMQEPVFRKARQGEKESDGQVCGPAIGREQVKPQKAKVALLPLEPVKNALKGKHVVPKARKESESSVRRDHVLVALRDRVGMPQVPPLAIVDACQTKIKRKPVALKQKQASKESIDDQSTPARQRTAAEAKRARLLDIFEPCETKLKRKPVPLKARQKRRLSAHTEEDDENLWAFIEAQHRVDRTGRVPLAAINA